MKSLCIAVPLKSGEKVRKELLDKGKLNKDLALEKDENFLYFPILCGKEKGEELGYMVSERDFKVLEKEIKSYKDFIEMPDKLKDLLPTSFDVIGQVAIVKIHDDVLDYKKIIGEAILKVHKSLETVAVDFGVEGEERIRNLEIVAGKDGTETVHKEYGIELETDPSMVYFSPRLAQEHWRVAQMVTGGEVVLDMFCGIGPFSIIIAKNRFPKCVYAMDINEKAIEYLKRNIKRNKVVNIVPLQGDSRVLVHDVEPVDRIIMNLPHSADEYLPSALSKIKAHGTIHYYEVLDHDNKDIRFEEIRSKGEEVELKITMLEIREVHTYSPISSLYCFDLKVERDDSNL
jgi:tRNA (guanine37-N1)-methyltransferase